MFAVLKAGTFIEAI